MNLNICISEENRHHQDARVRRRGYGREDQFRGVREHHRQVGRVGPQEDGGASVITDQAIEGVVHVAGVDLEFQYQEESCLSSLSSVMSDDHS